MTPTQFDAPTDAALVSSSLAGDRSAYGQIVTRYQRLLCSLAYSAMGNLSESEDVAQDAFIEGWRKLQSLQEPEKLRSWLCGILRYKISHRQRAASRRAEGRADSLDDEYATELESLDDPVENQVMKEEEQALLWQALERVPERYRDPLVLYYREHKSIEHVACDLDLTESTVKQRLSRGRKMLQEQMMAFVEGALTRSSPGRVFTLGVLAALPELATPAKAAGAVVGATVATTHGGTIAKTTAAAALMASLSGFISAVMALRASLDQSRTPKERRAVVMVTCSCVFGILALLGVVYGLRAASYQWWEHRLAFAHIAQAFSVMVMLMWPVGMFWLLRHLRELRSSERKRHPEYFRDARDQVGSTEGEFRSRKSLFGVPLVHFRFRTPDVGEPPVVGWIAGGDRAYGLLFAWGLCAVAPVSVGAFSVGFLTVGCVGFGLIALGNFAAGSFALGNVTFGEKALAWLLATGSETAQSGGFAIARLAAEGPIAFAQNANDPMARQILMDPNAERNLMVLFILITLLTLIPISYYAKETRRRLGEKAKAVRTKQ